VNFTHWITFLLAFLIVIAVLMVAVAVQEWWQYRNKK